MAAPIRVDRHGPVTVITINRPERRNAVDRVTADLLEVAFTEFDADDTASVAVLTGADGIQPYTGIDQGIAHDMTRRGGV